MAQSASLSHLNPKNILVRMPNWLGDLVMATPILTDLKKRWPQAKITVMCQGGTGTVLEEDPAIHEIFNFKKPKGWLPNQAHRDIITFLRQGNYDLGILLTNSFSSAWWFAKGHVQNRLGFASNFRSLLLNTAVPFPSNRKKQHLVITYKTLLEPLGISVSTTSPVLYVSDQEKLNAWKKLQEFGVAPQHILVGINPGAAYGSAKCWLPERFKEVTEKLFANPKIRVIFFGDKTGAPLVDEICQGMSDRFVNLAGKTNLRELMALIQACNIFLTNDSGPMHLASALKVPLLALFGSTSDVATSPYNGGKIIHKHVECSPCYRRECPIDFRCMTRIEVEEVYQELQELMKA